MPATVLRLFREKNGESELKAWLDALEQNEAKAFKKCFARIVELAELGNQIRRPHADYLRDGIYELRATTGTKQYRILYFFHGGHAVTLSHATGKIREVPAKEIDKAIVRMNLVNSDVELYTTEFELP